MWIYEAFNDFECLAWLAIAIALPFWLRGGSPQQRRSVWTASAILLVFAATDWFEAPTHGLLPGWLWAVKILCVGGLLLCRRAWLGERFRWWDRTHALALICLLIVLGVIALQWWLGDFLVMDRS